VLPQLWTQGASVRWRPEFRFYEARTGFLSKLDEKGLIRAWRIEGDEVSVRLKDTDHEALLNPRGIRLVATTPEPDIEPLMVAAETAFEEIKPRRITTVRLYFQHLHAIEGDYDEVRASSGRRLLGSLADDLKLSDYALLVDGRRGEPPYEYQVEFGVVSKAEIPRRLSRWAGRIRGEDRPYPQFRDLDSSKLPEIALFVDSNWSVIQPPPPNEIGHALREFWSAGRREADSLVERIRLTVTGDQ
jgi:hypothetical protein